MRTRFLCTLPLFALLAACQTTIEHTDNQYDLGKQMQVERIVGNLWRIEGEVVQSHKTVALREQLILKAGEFCNAEDKGAQALTIGITTKPTDPTTRGVLEFRCVNGLKNPNIE